MSKRKKRDSKTQTIIMTFGGLIALQLVALATLGKKAA